VIGRHTHLQTGVREAYTGRGETSAQRCLDPLGEKEKPLRKEPFASLGMREKPLREEAPSLPRRRERG